MPAITPQPSSPATSGLTAGFTLVHCPAWTRVFSTNAPMPSAGTAPGRRSRVIFWVALWVSKQYQGRPRRQARQLPHTARQLRMTKSPGATSVTPSPTDFDDPGGLVAEQERELVVDAALAVVQVGVADPAGLHLHHGLTRPRVRDRRSSRPTPGRPSCARRLREPPAASLLASPTLDCAASTAPQPAMQPRQKPPQAGRNCRSAPVRRRRARRGRRWRRFPRPSSTTRSAPRAGAARPPARCTRSSRSRWSSA